MVPARDRGRGIPLGETTSQERQRALARVALVIRQQQQAKDREAFGEAWQDTGLVFTTRSGRPVEPHNLDRSFRRICDNSNVRVIKVHHLRLTTASLLKKLRVPPRDAQMILGHAHISTTLQIDTHVDEEARDDARAWFHERAHYGRATRP